MKKIITITLIKSQGQVGMTMIINTLGQSINNSVQTYIIGIIFAIKCHDIDSLRRLLNYAKLVTMLFGLEGNRASIHYVTSFRRISIPTPLIRYCELWFDTQNLS